MARVILTFEDSPDGQSVYLRSEFVPVVEDASRTTTAQRAAADAIDYLTRRAQLAGVPCDAVNMDDLDRLVTSVDPRSDR